ncbi:MAG TPA: DegV family protein [Bacillota bacterium]
MKVGIVTDSGSDLSRNLAAELGIEIIPFHVNLNNNDYRDGIDITRQEFYTKLVEQKLTPKTSQPALGVFVDTYRRLLQKFDALLSIHISGKLSGTFQTAQMAREMIPGADIRVVDSLSASMGQGGLVLEAYRALQKGFSLDQVVKLLESLRKRVRLFVTLDTLEFLKRGGRVGRVTAFLGSVLRVKPLIRLVNGEVEPIAKARSRREAISLLLAEFKKEITAETKAIIAVLHTAAEEEALRLKTRIQEDFKQAEILLREAGPALGTHVGPGALALSVVPKISLAPGN